MTISYDDLREAVAGAGVGLRAITDLEPLGGPGDKVFPPTYGVSAGASTRYAVEQRRVDGESRPSVVLDSVASQANRLELALLDAYRAGELALPVVSVDFSDVAGLEAFDRISSLEAPHRIFDAILRDSLLDDVLFRASDVGRSITEAAPRSAAALYRHSPTTLLFGGWDSTGPKGGRGAKFERAITSEVVAIGIEEGRSTSSRIDPLGIERNAATVYQAPDGTWTLDEDEAVKDKKGAPVPVTGSGEGPAGRPSQVNHGNVTPSIVTEAGGVTADRIVATTVISFAQLRRLRFPVDTGGAPLTGDRRQAAEVAARTALAALGMAATVLAFEEGFDLRSRCVLVAPKSLRFDLIRRGDAPDDEVSVSRDEALGLLGTAVEAAAAEGLVWQQDELLLQPAERLVELVRRSQALAVEAPAEAEHA